MNTDPTHVIEPLVVTGHLDSARYLSGFFFFFFSFYSTLFCTHFQCFSTFVFLHTEFSNTQVTTANVMTCFRLLTTNEDLYSILLLFSIHFFILLICL